MMFPCLNPNRGKCLFFAGQSWGDMLRTKSGGAHLMNLLTSSNYFSGLYGRFVITGAGGTSTLKKYAPTNQLTSDVKHGYWWDEDTNQPGPQITGQVSVAGVPTTITTLAQAVNYWFSTSGFLTPTEVSSITDAILMQGQQDATAILTGEKSTWKAARAAWTDDIRSRINPSNPTSVRVHIDIIGRRESDTANESTQVIREAQLELAAEQTNWQIACEVYDLELTYQTDPLLGDDHMTEDGTLDFATRIWQSIVAPTTRKRGPVISGATLTGAVVSMPVVVESGETLVKPSAPYGIRIEVNGIAVTPSGWAWSGHTLQATLPSAPTPGTVRVIPIYGVMSGFTEATCIRYAAATSTSHPYYGRLNLPLRSGLPITL